jgi:lysozyme
MKPWQRKSGAGAAVIALALAGYFEGTRTTAYQDPPGIWTICTGHTRNVKAGDKATPAQCDAYLQQDMAIAFADVKRCIRAPLNSQQTAAFADAAYNAGAGVVCGSTLQRKANAGDMRGACAELSRWVYAGGKQLPGLVARRQAERELCEATL